MFRNTVIGVLILTELFTCESSLGYSKIHTKCCRQDEALAKNSSSDNVTYSCVTFNNEKYVLNFNITSQFPQDCNDEEYCIDHLVEEGQEVENQLVQLFCSNYSEPLAIIPDTFPKCCPQEHFYDTSLHRCVKSFINISSIIDELQGYFHLEVGLTACTSAIVDYELENLDNVLFTRSKSLVLPTKSFSFGSYCLDKSINTNQYSVRTCHPDLEICKETINDNDKIRCIRKCCNDGQFYIGTKCKPGFSKGLNLSENPDVQNPTEPFAIIPGTTCKKYLADRATYRYTIEVTGIATVQMKKGIDCHSPLEESYCMEKVAMGNFESVELFVCFEEHDKNKVTFQISKIAVILSCICLVLTLLGYSLLLEMRNLHGKTLMCHCTSLLLLYLLLAYFRFNPGKNDNDNPLCRAMGYAVLYTSLAAFCWLNVMCFDIWFTFGSFRLHGINERRRNLKKFICFSLYGWLVPACISLIAFLMQVYEKSLPDFFSEIIPHIGHFTCFFEVDSNRFAYITFFTLPVTILMITNIVFFIKTVHYCHKVKGEISKMKDRKIINERRKCVRIGMEKLSVSIKLFVVMGVSWLFECIAAAFPVVNTGGFEVVCIISDNYNCLQGVLIFCVFILKRKVLYIIQEKLHCRKQRKFSRGTSGTTESMSLTRTT